MNSPTSSLGCLKVILYVSQMLIGDAFIVRFVNYLLVSVLTLYLDISGVYCVEQLMACHRCATDTPRQRTR